MGAWLRDDLHGSSLVSLEVCSLIDVIFFLQLVLRWRGRWRLSCRRARPRGVDTGVGGPTCHGRRAGARVTCDYVSLQRGGVGPRAGVAQGSSQVWGVFFSCWVNQSKCCGCVVRVGQVWGCGHGLGWLCFSWHWIVLELSCWWPSSSTLSTLSSVDARGTAGRGRCAVAGASA